MKNVIRIIAVLMAFLVLPTSCIGQAKMFKSVASMSDVSSVYIGPAAMKFAKAASAFDNDMIASEAIKQINSLEVIDCDVKSRIPAVAEEVEKIITGMNLDVILETKDEDDVCIIYGHIPEDKSEYLESVLIESRSEDSYSIVYINGKIDIENLMKENLDAVE